MIDSGSNRPDHITKIGENISGHDCIQINRSDDLRCSRLEENIIHFCIVMIYPLRNSFYRPNIQINDPTIGKSKIHEWFSLRSSLLVFAQFPCPLKIGKSLWEIMKTLYRLLKVVHSLSSEVASKCCKCFCCLINMFGTRWCIIHLTPLTKFGYTIYFILNIRMKFSIRIFKGKKEKIILAWEYFFG